VHTHVGSPLGNAQTSTAQVVREGSWMRSWFRSQLFSVDRKCTGLLRRGSRQDNNRKDVLFYLINVWVVLHFNVLGAAFFFFLVVKYCQILTSNGQLLPSSLRKNFLLGQIHQKARPNGGWFTNHPSLNPSLSHIWAFRASESQIATSQQPN